MAYFTFSHSSIRTDVEDEQVSEGIAEVRIAACLRRLLRVKRVRAHGGEGGCGSCILSETLSKYWC